MNLDSNCEQVKTALLDYLMDEAPAEDRAIVERHAAACADCSRELGELRKTVSLVRRAEIQEAVPRPIRLVAEPVAGWTAFWRNPARLAFASSSLLCVAIAMLSLFKTSVNYQNGNFHIAFGSAAVSSAAPISGGRLSEVAPASAVINGLSEEQVKKLIAMAVSSSEAAQRERSELAVKTATNQMQQQWKQDVREIGESMRYFQAAQNVLWKGQVESQQMVSSLVQRTGAPISQ